MNSLLEPVDIYCERVGVAFWAEPVNAISNIAFVLAALFAARTARRLGVGGLDMIALLILAGLIGVGSFLFHTFANGWSSYADTIPIWSFVALFVLVSIHRIGGVKPGRIIIVAVVVMAALTVLFLASADGSTETVDSPPPFNGSLQYTPAVVALFVFSVVSWWRKSPMAPWIWAATATFCLSLALRTIDITVCPSWPVGTHFLWHSLNALMIWMLLDGMIKLRASQTGMPPDEG